MLGNITVNFFLLLLLIFFLNLRLEDFRIFFFYWQNICFFDRFNILSFTLLNAGWEKLRVSLIVDLDDLAFYVHRLIQVNALYILDASAAKWTPQAPVLQILQTILAGSAVPTRHNYVRDVLFMTADVALAGVGDLDFDLLSLALLTSSVLTLIVLLAAPLLLCKFQLIALAIKDLLLLEKAELTLLKFLFRSEQGYLLLLDG